MEALLLTRCCWPLIAIFGVVSLSNAVSHSKASVSLDAEGHPSKDSEIHINDKGSGITVESRKEVVLDEEGEATMGAMFGDAKEGEATKIEQPAFLGKEDGQKTHDEIGPSSFAQVEAEAMEYMDSSFVWTDRRRRRRRYDCRWGEWKGWTACTTTCGAGQSQRDRETDGPHWGGKLCVDVGGADPANSRRSEFLLCPLNADQSIYECSVDCNWAHWGNWGPCSKTCGHGNQVRQRGELPYTDIDGGKNCDDSLRKSSQECSRFACPVPCVFSEWSKWGGCSQTCGSGAVKTRTREDVGPLHGGAPCEGEKTTSYTCNNFHCPVDCAWSDWGLWGECSRPCGGGIKLRERTYEVQSQNGGEACAHTDEADEAGGGGSATGIVHKHNCNVQACPINCEWTDWGPPSPCTKDCGGGYMKEYRPKAILEADGGNPCTGPSTRNAACNVESCKVDCQYTEWVMEYECTQTCGGGIHTFSRDGVAAQNGGLECDEANKTKQEECNTHVCAAVEAGVWQSNRCHVAVFLLAALAPSLTRR